jgi:hypothetical protein
MKKLILAAGFVVAATSAPLAQGVYAAPSYGYYDYAPGYSQNYVPAYRYGYDRYNWSNNDTERGGPGPRVGAGSGMGIGSQR